MICARFSVLSRFIMTNCLSDRTKTVPLIGGYGVAPAAA